MVMTPEYPPFWSASSLDDADLFCDASGNLVAPMSWLRVPSAWDWRAPQRWTRTYSYCPR
jgi:hypothetical protein